MSLLFYDAVTKYASKTQGLQVWDDFSPGAVSFSTSLTPYGVGRSVALWDANTEAKAPMVNLPSTETKIRFGFWYRDSQGSAEMHFGFRNGVERLCQLTFEGTGVSKFERGIYNTGVGLVGTLSLGRTVGVWHWWEGYIGIGNSTGFGHFRRNGRQAGSFVDVDTVSSASTAALAGANQFLVMRSVYNANVQFKDFMVWKDDSEWPSGWIGPVRTDVLDPNADGTHTAWALSAGSSGWSLIDSLTLSTSDYVSSTSTGNQSSFDIEARPSDAGGTVRGVSAEMWGANIGGGSTEIAAGVIDGSTQAYGDADAVGSGRRVTAFFPTRPGSTVAWSSTDIDGLEITVRHG